MTILFSPLIHFLCVWNEIDETFKKNKKIPLDEYYIIYIFQVEARRSEDNKLQNGD